MAGARGVADRFVRHGGERRGLALALACHHAGAAAVPAADHAHRADRLAGAGTGLGGGDQGRTREGARGGIRDRPHRPGLLVAEDDLHALLVGVALLGHGPHDRAGGFRLEQVGGDGDVLAAVAPAHHVKAGGEQVLHVVVPRRGGRAAQHHGDQAAPVALGRGGEVEAGGGGVAGLEAVHARHGFEQVVMVAHHFTVIGELAKAEVAVILWVVPHHRPRQDGDIARAAELAGVGQARSVGEVGVVHAQFAGPQGHQGGEALLGAADPLGQGHCHVIGGLHGDGAHGLVDRDGLAGPQPELGRRHGRRVGGDHQAV